MKTIVSVIPVEDEDKRLLEQAAPGYRLLFAQPREIPADGLRDAEVILGNVPRSVLREAIRLRWLQLNSAGADLYLQPGVLIASAKIDVLFKLTKYLKEKSLGLVVFNIYLELISCRCISKALTEIFISQIHTHSEAANRSNPIPNIQAAMICHEI